MTKNDASFEVWFTALQFALAGEGLEFTDTDSVKEDYQEGVEHFEVFDSICEEYGIGEYADQDDDYYDEDSHGL